MRFILSLTFIALLGLAHAQPRPWNEIQQEHRESMERLDHYLDCRSTRLEISRPTMNLSNAESAVDEVLAHCRPLARAALEMSPRAAGNIVIAVSQFEKKEREELLSLLGIVSKNGKCEPIEKTIIALSTVCKSRFPGNKFGFRLRPEQCRDPETDRSVAAQASAMDDAHLRKDCEMFAGLSKVGRMLALPYPTD